MDTPQTKGLNRNTIDKYYTKDIVVELCLNLVKKHIQINADDLIIEPSAGNGSFITGIKALTSNASSAGKIVQTGYEATINGTQLSIQKIELQAKEGKIG